MSPLLFEQNWHHRRMISRGNGQSFQCHSLVMFYYNLLSEIIKVFLTHMRCLYVISGILHIPCLVNGPHSTSSEMRVL